MANFQVRGCCCGIPFGFGTVIVALLGWLLWRLAGMVPDLVAFLPLWFAGLSLPAPADWLVPAAWHLHCLAG